MFSLGVFMLCVQFFYATTIGDALYYPAFAIVVAVIGIVYGGVYGAIAWQAIMRLFH